MENPLNHLHNLIKYNQDPQLTSQTGVDLNWSHVELQTYELNYFISIVIHSFKPARA